MGVCCRECDSDVPRRLKRRNAAVALPSLAIVVSAVFLLGFRNSSSLRTITIVAASAVGSIHG